MNTKEQKEQLKNNLNTLVEEASEEKVSLNIIKGRKTLKPNKPFAMVFYTNFSDLLAEFNLSQIDLRVLFKVLEYVSFRNVISLTQKTIADELDLTIPQVNRSYKKLENSKIFYKHKGSIFLNPKYMVKGNLKDNKESDAYIAIRNQIYEELKENIKNDEELSKAVYKKLPF